MSASASPVRTLASAGYQVCTRCIMDTTDPAISFDADGVCNHCRGYERRVEREVFVGAAGDAKVAALLERIRADGKGKPYDCVIGVSGGVDSTYVAWLVVKKYGLRPLAVHFDNGWNSELAVKNIEEMVKRLGIDLHTHVVDWDEFRDLQVSFLRAGVSNWEVPTDHAITALMYRSAAAHGIRWIISGSNVATEAIMPSAWMHDKNDLKFLRAIHRRFGTRPLRTLPMIGLLRFAWYVLVRRIKFVPLLNYVDYSRYYTE